MNTDDRTGKPETLPLMTRMALIGKNQNLPQIWLMGADRESARSLRPPRALKNTCARLTDVGMTSCLESA